MKFNEFDGAKSGATTRYEKKSDAGFYLFITGLIASVFFLVGFFTNLA